MQWCPLFASNFIKACGTWAKPRNRESELVTAVALYAYSETITELERTRTNQYQDFLVPVFDFVRSVGRSVTADQKCTVWSPIWTIASCEATKVWNDFENLFLTAGKTWHSRDYKTAQLLNNRNASQLVCYTDRRVFYILRQISLWLLSLSHRQYRKLPHMSILHFFALSLSSRVVIVFRKLRSKCSVHTKTG